LGFHQVIITAISNYIVDNYRMPSNTKIAELTGLSRQTVTKHIQDFNSSERGTEEQQKFLFMRQKLLGTLYRLGVEFGDVRAIKVLLDNMESKTTQNFIQVNNIAINIEAMKALRYNRYFSVLSTFNCRSLQKIVDPNIPKMIAFAEVQFLMEEHLAQPSDKVIVPVKVKDFKDIAGYQFTLSWDSEVLELIEVNNHSVNGYYGENRIAEGLLTTSWNDESGGAESLDDVSVMFELKFKVTGQNGSYSEIKICSEPTPSEAYNNDLQLLAITPTHGMVKVGESSNRFPPLKGWNLSVQPNPFSNSTSFIFTLPQDEAVNIVIYDLLGKIIRQFKADYRAGEHRIEWVGDDEDGNELSKGLYHVRMVTRNYSEGQKVVLMR